MRKAMQSTKRNLKDSQGHEAEYEERLRSLTSEVERTRRESATAIAKASSDKRGADSRERRSAGEAAKAKSEAKRLEQQLKARLLESAVLSMPYLKRAKRLARGVSTWRRAVQHLGRRAREQQQHDYSIHPPPSHH